MARVGQNIVHQQQQQQQTVALLLFHFCSPCRPANKIICPARYSSSLASPTQEGDEHDGDDLWSLLFLARGRALGLFRAE